MEVEILKLFRAIFPPSMVLRRGFVTNSSTGLSREQDILILDGYRSISLLSENSDPVFPIESVFGSIQIKSNLGKREWRDSIINSISVKRLVTNRSEPNIVQEDRVMYVVFAFTSKYDLKELEKKLNEEIIESEFKRYPDVFAIADKGILFKTENTSTFKILHRQKVQEIYKGFDGFSSKGTERAIEESFLWMILSIVDHVDQELKSRPPMGAMGYVAYPVMLRAKILEAVGEKEAEKYIG